ncbi:MAG: hypothetical protein B6D56_03365 [Candidatus Omnitrophica bacterium 4484_70.1]|nr:MAG: hypothetical protein B6D56_03365 [Candidatus Omnitrophica bacterium 4484_70.1]
MEKRAFLFLILSLFFFLFYFQWLNRHLPPRFSKKEGDIPEKKRKRVEIVSSEEILKEVSTDKFVVTYSITGGYIKKILIKPYKESPPFQNIGYSPQDRGKIFKLTRKNDTVILSSDDTVKEFKFKGFLIHLKIKSPEKPEIFFSNSLESNRLSQRFQEVFYKEKAILKRAPFFKVKEKDLLTSFLGARSRYYCLVFRSKKDFSSRLIRRKKEIQGSLILPSGEIDIYVGPQSLSELKKYGFEEVVSYGMFHGIALILIKILYFFNSFTKNWGLSIILVSTTIYLLLFPFTAKSTKAMREMQKLQPQVEELKKKYKDNPSRLNKELIELYRQHRVNPLGGCLPLFFQLPIFIALYQVLLRLVELKGAKFLWIKDLTSPDKAISLKITLPFVGEYINILPLLLVIINLLQQKFTQVSSQDAQQKQIGMFFVIFIGIIFYHFPSGLVLYWLTQNIFTFIYQFRLYRVSFS